jgi:hypothetical protein
MPRKANKRKAIQAAKRAQAERHAPAKKVALIAHHHPNGAALASLLIAARAVDVLTRRDDEAAT